jgi:hypothetical protein
MFHFFLSDRTLVGSFKCVLSLIVDILSSAGDKASNTVETVLNAPAVIGNRSVIVHPDAF